MTMTNKANGNICDPGALYDSMYASILEKLTNLNRCHEPYAPTPQTLVTGDFEAKESGNITLYNRESDEAIGITKRQARALRDWLNQQDLGS